MTTSIACLFQVDSFTSVPFKGNPAGVCVSTLPLEEEFMQNLAAEMNLAETAFVCPVGEGRFGLRWFTPETEVPLCGHATLASAHVLWEQGLESREKIVFETRSGELQVWKAEGMYVMDFPANHSVPASPEDPACVMLVGIGAVEVLRSEGTVVAVLQSPEAVRTFSPDLAAIAKHCPFGLIITAADQDYDFVSRFFAPNVGINEDPVTGYAHTILGPLWHSRLGKRSFRAYQASKRGGEVHVQVLEGETRVLLKGQAVTVFSLSSQL